MALDASFEVIGDSIDEGAEEDEGAGDDDAIESGAEAEDDAAQAGNGSD